MAELAEEYSRLTKKILKYSIISVIVIHALLLVLDGFHFFTTLFGIALHGVYYQFLKDFPFVKFSEPLFLGACVGLLVNHYLWIVYFREEYQYRVPQARSIPPGPSAGTPLVYQQSPPTPASGRAGPYW